MKPSSFSVREQQHYRAEKMRMRQFMLMKMQYQTLSYVSEDMKERLLAGRSFQEESHWRAFKCFNPVSIICPKAEQDVQIFLCHLSNKLLNSFAGCHTSSKLALFVKLQWTAVPFAPQVLETALKFLLDEPEPLDEVRTSQSQGAIVSRDSSLSSTLRNRVDSADSQTGKQLAEAAATCLCMDPPCLLHVCTSVARDMVKAIYRRFEDHSKTFHLMDLDESFFTARESAVCAIQDMDDRVQSDAHNWNLYQLHKVKEPMVILNPTKESSYCYIYLSDKDKSKK
ncbi:hypothetical protein ABVT39_024719 [Epinephelus coioides]